MVYQGLLLSDRRRLRTESIEEHATPNSAPAQWPGNTSDLTSQNTCREIAHSDSFLSVTIHSVWSTEVDKAHFMNKYFFKYSFLGNTLF